MFAGKTYKTQASNNCCVKHRDQATEKQNWGMTGSDCNRTSGNFVSGPILGGAGCSGANQNYEQQLTLCQSK
jgi:hypothetical protein